MLKEWFKKAWKFCTEPAPQSKYPYEEYLERTYPSDTTESTDFLLTTCMIELNKWCAEQAWQEYLLSQEYYDLCVARFENYCAVNLNAAVSAKRK